MTKSIKKSKKIDERTKNYILNELEEWKCGNRGSKLTWDVIQKFSGYSRVGLSSHPEIKKSYNEAKEMLRTGKTQSKAINHSFEYYEGKINALEKEIKAFKEKEEEWLERWARIAYHSKLRGLSIEELDKEI